MSKSHLVITLQLRQKHQQLASSSIRVGRRTKPLSNEVLFRRKKQRTGRESALLVFHPTEQHRKSKVGTHSQPLDELRAEFELTYVHNSLTELKDAVAW